MRHEQYRSLIKTTDTRQSMSWIRSPLPGAGGAFPLPVAGAVGLSRLLNDGGACLVRELTFRNMDALWFLMV